MATDPTTFTNVGSATSNASVPVPGLNPSTQYDLDVIASNSAGSATSGVLTATTLSGVPSQPLSLQIGVVTTTSITLSWAASTGAQPLNYQPQYRLAGQTTWANFGSPNASLSCLFSALAPSSTYEFQVIAVNAYGSVGSAIISGTTGSLGVAPSAPNVIVSSVTPTAATLSWSPSNGTAPISYQPQYRISGQIPWNNAGSPTQFLFATIDGLNSGVTYDFQVMASNAAGTSISPVQTAATTIPATPPSAPGTPVPWIITPTSVSLTWAASSTGSAPIGYVIQYRIHGTFPWTSSGAPAAATSGTASGLTPSTNYDFQILASNTAGTSNSNFVTILAPITGGTVTGANFQPNTVLRAGDLDASLDSKLNVSGGPVGPLQLSQTATGGGQPALLALSRTAGGSGDAPLITGTYTAVMADGPVVPYGGVAITINITGDSSAIGPAGNIWGLSGAVSISSLRSTQAGTDGSKHAGLTGRVIKTAPTSGVPSGRRLADGSAVYAPAADSTGLPSSQSGTIMGLHSPISANGRDDANLRYGARIVYAEATPVSSGGAALEFARGLYLGTTSGTAYAQVILELGGGFNSAALDLRGANAYTATIISGSPGSPVTAISVDRALMFSAAGSPPAAVTASNPKTVRINGNLYSVVAVSVTPGASSGVLNFTSPVSVADAAQGNQVIPDTHTIWLSEGGGGVRPGDIAFNRSGTSRILYDAAGGGTTIASGLDRTTILSSAAIRIPVGTNSQRPTAALLGDIRANADTSTYEVWQPSTASWVSLGSSTTAATTGAAAGPATALIAGTPTTNAVPLSWVAPTTGTLPYAYQVQFRIAGISGWTNWGAPQSSTSTTVSGLTAGTRYDFQIVTSNSYGSSPSAITSVNILAVAPSAPTGVATSQPTSTTMLLSWTASSSGSTPISYQPQYAAAGSGIWINSPAGALAGVSQTITGLSAATSYDFRVVASNGGGSATSSTVTTSTSTAASVAPSAATGVSAGSATSNSLVVTWTAPASGSTPLSYAVLYRVTGTTPFSTFAPTTGLTTTVTGLTSATSYDFEVTATNSAGTSTSTSVTSLTSAPPTVLAGAVAGTQTTGTSSPIITGPATGAVVTGNVLSITGITITDTAASTASGACTLSMTCSVGTVSSTVIGAQVAGSGSKTISFSNTLSACQIAAANLQYTGSGTAGSDTIAIKFVDQLGLTHSISVSITISAPTVGSGTGGTIPTDAAGEVATPAQKVLNGFGVRTHIDSATYQTAGLGLIENCINYLGGIKLIRDAAASTSDSTWWPQVSQTSNVQFIGFIAQDSATNFSSYITNIKSMPVRYIAALEGCDEADTGNATGRAETLSDAAAFQPTVWTTGQNLNVPVIQLSCGQGFNTNPTQGNYGAFGDQSAYANYGNAHIYCGGSPQSDGLVSTYVNTLAKLGTPGKPAAITAFGWIMSASGGGYNVVTETTAAAYVLLMIFDAYLVGAPYYIWHGLLDDVPTDGAARGLFSDDGTPKKPATAIKNFFTLLTDTNTNATSFTPGKLNYSLTNFPTSNGKTGGGHLLLQKSDGTFWLALWNEQQLNDKTTGADLTVTPINITLTLGATPTSITVYDPAVSATSVQSAGAVTSLTISLPARPILVKIVHA